MADFWRQSGQTGVPHLLSYLRSHQKRNAPVRIISAGTQNVQKMLDLVDSSLKKKMEKTTNQHAHIPHCISAKLGHASGTPPQPTTGRTLSIFFQKRGTPISLINYPALPIKRRVESKGAAGIPRQPITSRFIGYPTFSGRPCG